MCADSLLNLFCFPHSPFNDYQSCSPSFLRWFSRSSLVVKFLRASSILDLFAKCVKTAFILEDPTRLADDRTEMTSLPPADGSPAMVAAASGATVAVGGWADAGEESAYAWVLVRLHRLSKKK